MKPSLEVIDRPLVRRILDEAFQLLAELGVRVGAPSVAELLAVGGAEVANGVARIPKKVALQALESAPHEFVLYDRGGHAVVHYGGDQVHFDPGSSCVYVLDPETLTRRPATTSDLVRLVQVTEVLPQFAAQSTAVVCNDAPKEIGDLYRLYVVLKYSTKPVVTGAFTAESLPGMIDLLAIDVGGHAALRQRPRAVFDVCPSPPLNWSEFGGQNLVDLARTGVPAQIVSMPMAGATAPVTLAGAVVQHAAETISGITIHQLASPGAPVVWGGAPSIFDMRTGTTPMGAMETIMLNLACAQVGKHVGLPTHGYLAASDAKLVDAQAGMESGISAVLGALGGINMISGAGMLDFLACHSVEKLVIDAEAIASALRLREGIQPRTADLALAMLAQTGFSGEFLKLKETRALFRSEQHLPSAVIDRDSVREGAASDAFQRARARVEELVTGYKDPGLSASVLQQFSAIVEREAERAGVVWTEMATS